MSSIKKSYQKKTYARWHLVVLFLIPLILYAQSFGFNFVFHDDDSIILQNAEVLKQFDWHKLLFTDAWILKKQIELYRPLQSITFALDYQLGQTGATVYHVHNVLAFALGIVLLYLFFIQLGITATHSFLLSAIYGVHYLFANTVCWIPARGDIYLFVFSMITLLLWFKVLHLGHLLHVLLAALTYFLALMAKESAIVLLPIILLITYQRQKLQLRNTRLMIFGALGLILTAIYFYMRSLSIINTPNIFTLEGFLYNIRIIPEQTGKFFLPAFFSVMPAFSTLLTLLGCLVLTAIASLLFVYRKQLPMGMIWLGAALFLLPTLPAVVYKPQFTGFAYDYLDHRLFFPATGLLLIAYQLVQLLISKRISTSYIYILMLVLAGYSYFASRSYTDYKTYYTNATETNPRSGLAWMNFGTLSTRENNYDMAFKYFYKAKEVVPDNIELRLKIADSHLTLKQWDAMKRECKEIIAKSPKTLKAYYNIADYYVEMNQPDSMRSWMQRAYRQDSSSADYYYYYAFLYKHLNIPDSSIHYFGECINRNASYSLAYFNRGLLYGNKGNYEGALNDFEQYISKAPGDPNAYFYYGQALCITGNAGKGCEYLKEADKRGVKEAQEKINYYCR